jgi:mono/diheme cytochrome c family protein
MKTLLKVVGVLLVALLLAAGSVYGWARHRDASLLSRTIDTHRVDFPVPFPLSEEEVARVRQERADADEPPPTDAELDSLALERARASGDHLVHARYGCVECHGADLGGGVMVDDPMIGRILGPNITRGRGGRTADYAAADWDRIVRHGVRPDGTPAAMPSEDFGGMSDHELSDIVAYIRSLPTVDAHVAPVRLGPLGTVLLAVGKIRLSADMIQDHRKVHSTEPPPEGATVEFGAHLARTCSGCHRADFTGGPIPGGAPDWAPAANLTPHEDGLAGWTYDRFVSTLKTGERPDGTPLRAPMSGMVPYARRMTDVELRALWAYLRSLPPKPSS